MMFQRFPSKSIVASAKPGPGDSSHGDAKHTEKNRFRAKAPAPARRPFDFFVDIGNAAREDSDLFEPQPPVLPRRLLPARKHNPEAAFNPEPKLSNQADLRRELERMRKRFAPFLLNRSPLQPATRSACKLSRFDRRVAESADFADFQRVLAGRGRWKKVILPDFGEPLGRAVVFYRTPFVAPEKRCSDDALFVRFCGVDYKAQVFINGTLVGSHEGFFGPFEFDITPFLRRRDNVLVVRVENDYPCLPFHGNDGDKIYAATGPGYNDPNLGWHHCPPGMGIWQDVFLEWRPPVHISDLFVRPLPTETAELWVEVWNGFPHKMPVDLRFSLWGSNFRRRVFQDRRMGNLKDAGPGVNYYRCVFPMENARRWEPDSPWLYELQAELLSGKPERRDRRSRVFGMRTFEMEERGGSRGRMLLNGSEIRLRGANTMGFEQLDVMRGDTRQLHDDILLARIAGMNFLRLTQRPVQDEVYEACDRLGMMTQTDLPLFGCLRRNQFCEAVKQAQEMERILRPHPCNILVSLINEPFPPHWPDTSHRNLTRPELNAFFQTATTALRLWNPDRVVKAVDGDFNPPAPGLPDRHCYTFWYNGHGIEAGKLLRGYWQRIGKDWDYYGCGEFGAEGLDRVELMRRHCPKDWLPRPGEDETSWTPSRIAEAQTGKLHRLWFDTQTSVEDWVRASRQHQEWAVRLQTEAFRRDNRMNSFALHLFIDAWPTGWMKTIMDVERQAKPAYFAYRDALRPVAVSLRTDRWMFQSGETMEFEAWICNDRHETPRNLRLHYQLEGDGRVIFSGKIAARLEPCRSLFQGFLRLKAPAVKTRGVFSVRLGLLDAKGKVSHSSVTSLAVFPKIAAAPHRPICVLGGSDGWGRSLLKELGLERNQAGDLTGASVILIDDFSFLRNRHRQVESAVARGARVIFAPLALGSYSVAGTLLRVENPARGARQFVSRNTGHPLVEGHDPFDFRFWHDPSLGRIAPLMDHLVLAEGWEPVLLTTHPNEAGEWGDAFAAAELRRGRGSWIVCQVKLAGLTSTNPPARQFALRLLGGNSPEG